MSALIANFGGAAVLSGLISATLAGLLALAGRRPAARDLPALALLVLFLTLTQYPLPDRATMICPKPLTEPAFWPGNSVTHLVKQVKTWGWMVLFDDSTFFAALMNFALCALIGAALAWQGRFQDRAILVFAVLMPLAIELTQITGTWGIFPCAYRKFDADDLVLNALGIACGLAFGRRRRWMLREG